MPDPVPQQLRDFVLRYIDSVGQLEALLIMRAAPSANWSAETLAPRLYTSPEEAAAFIARLAADGFLVRDGDRFRFECASAEMARLLDALATFYAANIIPVTNLIHSRPRRIREFADAFKLKKDH